MRLDDPLGRIRGISGCVGSELECIEAAGDVRLFEGFDLLLGIEESRQQDMDVRILLHVVGLIDARAEKGEAEEDLEVLAAPFDGEGGKGANQDRIEVQDGVAKAGEFLHRKLNSTLADRVLPSNPEGLH